MPHRPRGHEDSPLGGAVTNTLRVMVNGAPRALPADTTVAALIALLDVRGRYAVEVNGEIVPRSTHAEHRLLEGDRVEVVAAIGGG
ncbi:MAG: sulfur carrier protein ThiS [Gammaproteobacteria bacterium]|nr:sulfur carrier protein ThiS [Gammaproteobacteria bacterium]